MLRPRAEKVIMVVIFEARVLPTWQLHVSTADDDLIFAKQAIKRLYWFCSLQHDQRKLNQFKVSIQRPHTRRRAFIDGFHGH
jgi:hypothetical protein